MNNQIIEVQPKDSLPTFEVFGTQWTIPTSSLNTVLLFLLCAIKVKEALEAGSKGIKLALTALDRLDIAVIDAMDDLAVEIRETTNADRVSSFCYTTAHLTLCITGNVCHVCLSLCVLV